MLRLAALFERLSQAVRRSGAAVLAAAAEPAPRPVRRRTRVATPVRRRRRARPLVLEQLAMDLGPERPRWTYSRFIANSPHQARVIEHLEFARRFFPELEGLTIHVGMAKKRGVLGWGSMDPERPGIWVRPRQLYLFTIAHEFTHLLQARGLVPRGERQCDLFALARTPLLVDHVPGYLKLPGALRRGRPSPKLSQSLCEAARRALAAREAGDRRYLAHFEREVAETIRG